MHNESKDHDPGADTLTCAEMLVNNYLDTVPHDRVQLHELYTMMAKHKGEPQRLAYAMALAHIEEQKSAGWAAMARWAEPTLGYSNALLNDKFGAQYKYSWEE